MIHRVTLLCLLATLSTAGASGSQLDGQSDREVLIQLQHDWDAALHRNDVVFIERILADEYMATYPDGSRADKGRELALAAEFDQRIESSQLDEFTVRVYGDTAIVWFTQHLTGPIQGRTVTLTNRYVDVFVRRDGRWQCVASQSTRVGPPARP